MTEKNNWTPTKPLPPSPAPVGWNPPKPLPPTPKPEATPPKPKNEAMFRVRKTMLGNKCVLQKFTGDIIKGPPPGFRDVPWRPDIGAFTIVPRADWDAVQKRIELADKRAAQQRDARKKKRDFEASQLAPPGHQP